jgi:cytochrome c-type biogenesis protein CcmH/NrfF
MILGLWTGDVAQAQGGDQYPNNVDPDEVYRIARSMYCDVCQGVPLSDCPSSQCRAWREEIADLLSQGYNETQIREQLGKRYGEKISGVPLSEDNRLFTFLVPIGLAAIIAIFVLLRTSKLTGGLKTKAAEAAASAGLLEGYDRPVPDNVDSVYLERFLTLLNEEN